MDVQRGKCLKCGHEITLTTGRCPNCGSGTTLSLLRTYMFRLPQFDDSAAAKCANCGKVLYGRKPYCPRCQAPIDAETLEKVPSKKTLISAGIALLAVWALVIFALVLVVTSTH